MIILFNTSNTLKAFKYENFMTNGNMDDTTSWNAEGSTISASNNILTVTGNGSSAVVGTQRPNILAYSQGKKIYVKYYAQVTNSSCLNFTCVCTASGMATQTALIKATPVADFEYTLSGMFTLTPGGSGNINIRFRSTYVDAATANGKVMKIRQALCVDLTALFGAGNEPALADCNNIFKFIDGTLQPNFSNTLLT